MIENGQSKIIFIYFKIKMMLNQFLLNEALEVNYG